MHDVLLCVDHALHVASIFRAELWQFLVDDAIVGARTSPEDPLQVLLLVVHTLDDTSSQALVFEGG